MSRVKNLIFLDCNGSPECLLLYMPVMFGTAGHKLLPRYSFNAHIITPHIALFNSFQFVYARNEDV